MKVLIISVTTFPISPSGPAYIAGAARDAGHTVEVFDCFCAQDLVRELEGHITRFNPDVVGISIRFVTGKIVDKKVEFYTKPFDARPKVKEIVNCIQRMSQARIVLGGCGFNYFGCDWLEYLDLDYGIRGEAEFSFPLYLQRLEEDGDIYSVPGCIFRKDGHIYKVPRERIERLDDTALPAYDLFELDRYTERNISPGIFTKRGCVFHCIYCPYHSLEGARYRLKSPTRVVDEIEHIYTINPPKMITFCDNNFNAPKSHAIAICKEILHRKLNITWGTGSLKPFGFTDDLCRLFQESGCGYVNLSIETASETMLKRMNRGCTVDHITQALTCLSRSEIPFGISLMFGAPGETPQTIAETFEVIDRFQIPQGVWVTIGINLWTHHQHVVDDARRDSQLHDDKELFEGIDYLSPELPKVYMIELTESLKTKGNYTIQVNKPYVAYS